MVQPLRSGIGPGGLAMDYGGYGGGGIQDLLGEGMACRNAT